MQSRLPWNPSRKTIPTIESSGAEEPRDEGSSISLPLPLPSAAVSIEGIVWLHLIHASLAQKAPRLSRLVLDAVHHGILAIAVRTHLRFAHGQPVSREFEDDELQGLPNLTSHSSQTPVCLPRLACFMLPLGLFEFQKSLWLVDLQSCAAFAFVSFRSVQYIGNAEQHRVT